MKHAIVIRHIAFEDLGNLAEVLDRHDYALTYVEAGLANVASIAPLTPDLASSSKYQNQAFSWGKCGLALQFHPEVTARNLERWFIGHACEIGTTSGISIAQLREDTVRYAQPLELQANKFWQAWLKDVLG